MKGNSRIIELLNNQLATEQTAINQYQYNEAYNRCYEYDELADMFHDRARDERHHYKKLMARILMLDGIPIINQPIQAVQGVDIRTQLENDLKLELQSIQDYDRIIHIATCGDTDLGVNEPDNETARILKDILKEEVEHVHEIEALLQKIADMGRAGFLGSYAK